MTRWEWVVKVLSDNAKEEMPEVYKKWLYDNVLRKNVRVNVESCICNELEWTDNYKGVFFVQDDKTYFEKELIDSTKPALVLVQYFYDVKDSYYLVYWYNPDVEVCENTLNKEKVACNVKQFKLPTFEEWQENGKKIEVFLGAYRVEIRMFCLDGGYTECVFSMIPYDGVGVNVYAEKIFSSYFNLALGISLKQWYDSTVETFYDFWEQYVNTSYIESNV